MIENIEIYELFREIVLCYCTCVIRRGGNLLWA